jgi:hypothetical protein
MQHRENHSSASPATQQKRVGAHADGEGALAHARRQKRPRGRRPAAGEKAARAQRRRCVLFVVGDEGEGEGHERRKGPAQSPAAPHQAARRNIPLPEIKLPPENPPPRPMALSPWPAAGEKPPPFKSPCRRGSKAKSPSQQPPPPKSCQASQEQHPGGTKSNPPHQAAAPRPAGPAYAFWRMDALLRWRSRARSRGSMPRALRRRVLFKSLQPARHTRHTASDGSQEISSYREQPATPALRLAQGSSLFFSLKWPQRSRAAQRPPPTTSQVDIMIPYSIRTLFQRAA